MYKQWNHNIGAIDWDGNVDWLDLPQKEVILFLVMVARDSLDVIKDMIAIEAINVGLRLAHGMASLEECKRVHELALEAARKSTQDWNNFAHTRDDAGYLTKETRKTLTIEEVKERTTKIDAFFVHLHHLKAIENAMYDAARIIDPSDISRRGL